MSTLRTNPALMGGGRYALRQDGTASRNQNGESSMRRGTSNVSSDMLNNDMGTSQIQLQPRSNSQNASQSVSRSGSPSRSETNTSNNNRFQMAMSGGEAPKKGKKAEKLRKYTKPGGVLVGKMTHERKLWLFAVTCLTGWVPTWLLWMFNIRGEEVVQAWREKFALCVILFLSSLVALGWLEFSTSVLCPQVPGAISWGDVSTMSNVVVANGKVLDITRSRTSIGIVLKKYVGKDVSSLFPKFSALGHPSANSSQYLDTAIQACIGNNSDAADRWLFNRITNDWSKTLNLTANGKLIGCPAPGGAAGATEQCFYSDSAWNDYNNMVIGDLLLSQAALAKTMNLTNVPDYVVIFNNVYDVSQYLRYAVLYQTDNINNASYSTVGIATLPYTMFFPQEVTMPLARGVGTDVTGNFTQTSSPTYLKCMDKLFYAGRVTPQIFRTICQFGNPLLLVFTGCIYSVVVIKFAISLLFTFSVRPAMMNQYCICFVPCYTEGFSMKVTLDTLARCDYPDDRKLLVVVCDGNITGKGNKDTTPRIALEMLGWKGEEPEAKLYHSLGKGADKINMAKAYCGFYQLENHRVPFVVIAKVGKPDEAKKPKPGNRGKRDSQLILMNFFNKLVNKREMSPFEYELYYLIKNVIGVDPNLYEYCLMVDADTEVEPDSMNELVAAMVNDQRKIGVCGETQVANKWTSWVTMIQVHEYYINHHLGKAFESMFGSVTCLPGCFSMYRVRNMAGEAFLVHDDIIQDYKVNKVHTLHSKNLLHLGEDRYLTTLLLKHFPARRLEFIPSAICRTDIPDSFQVFLSQRRRWINSTFHNLYEVMKLPRLCSYCFISMKTLVLLDMISTMLLPAGTLYLYSLIIRMCFPGQFDKYSMVVVGVAGLYATHVIILMLKRQYEYGLWITIYIILGMPVFSVILPLYAFWHFDDFSWGSTRQIEGADDGHHEGNAEGQIKNIEQRTLAEYEAKDPRLSGASANMDGGMVLKSSNVAPSDYGSPVKEGVHGHVMGAPIVGSAPMAMTPTQIPGMPLSAASPMAMPMSVMMPVQYVDPTTGQLMVTYQAVAVAGAVPGVVAPQPVSAAQPAVAPSPAPAPVPAAVPYQTQAAPGTVRMGAGTVGAAFERMFNEMQAATEGIAPSGSATNLTGLGGSPQAPIAYIPAAAPVPSPAAHPMPMPGMPPGVGMGAPAAAYPMQLSGAGGLHPGQPARPATAAGMNGGTVGAAFAEAFKALQDMDGASM